MLQRQVNASGSGILGLFAVYLFLFGGCATFKTVLTGTVPTPNNNHVQMPGYSFARPPDQGWRLERDDSRDYAILTKRIEPVVWQIRTYKNPVRSDVLVAASAKEIADDFRKLGVVNMTEEGVNKGLYELRDVKMGEEIVGEKKFYTMEHVIFNRELVQKVSTYLYFPQPANNQFFFVAHYFETTPPNANAKSFRQDFLNVLTNLTLK